MSIYESLRSYFLEEVGVENIVSYDKDQTIFNVDDIADYVYFILQGSVNLHLPNENTPKDITLVRGDLFGELSELRGAPRAATVVADEFTTLIRLDIEEFKKFYEKNPELQKLLEVLGNTYSLPNKGKATQYFGKVLGANAITMSFKLDGRFVVAMIR